MPQLFSTLRYCVRCCMPETQEGVEFDEFGVCRACRSSEQKLHINWKDRENKLSKILEKAKKEAGNNYDCILPISGGKDSTFQMYVLTQRYGMKPLAVTFSHNWMSKTGWYNLQNSLQQFNIDHIMFTPNRNLVNRIAKKSLEMIGDTCWHCHAGVGAFSLQVAVRFKIPLIVWGESTAESSGRASYECPLPQTRDSYIKTSMKYTAEHLICDYLSEKDLYPFEVPSNEEMESVGIKLLWLGDYIFWDEARQTEFIRDHFGWRETQIEGAYKGYKSAECIMAGMHDFTCYLKRGFGRSTVQACTDIRDGLLTREEGFDIISKLDTVRPEALDYYLKITGMTEEEFYSIMRTKMHEKLKEEVLPIKKKSTKNKEEIYPFVEKIIKNMSKRKDMRDE